MWWTILIAALALVLYLGFRKRSPDDNGRAAEPSRITGGYEVVGESKYQETLDRIAGGKTRDGHELAVDARLVLEDENPYDNKAVMVCIDGETVGYLSRAAARRLRAAAPPNTTVFACRAKIVGGWKRGRDSGHYGVELDC